MNCKRCNDTGTILVAVENGAGHSIPCYECQPLGEREIADESPEPDDEDFAFFDLLDDMKGVRTSKGELVSALLRVGTRMANLCMKYGSVRGPVDQADRERMLDLDESWHQILADLHKFESDHAKNNH